MAARLNIDSSFWTDSRFTKLCIKLGDEINAIGQVILLWRLAQERFWKDKFLSEIQFKEAGLSEFLFECKFAERTESGIRAKGDKKYFAWLKEKQEAGRKGGKASGISRKQNSKTKQNEANASTLKQNEHSYSSSYSSSSSNSNSNSNSNSKEFKNILNTTTIKSDSSEPSVRPSDFQTSINPLKSKKEKPPAITTNLWVVYRNEFFEKWKEEPPPRNAKTNAQLKMLLSSFGEDKAIAVIRHYFVMNDAFFHKSFHPLGLLVKQGHQIYTSMTTGIQITNTQMQQMDKKAHAANMIQRIRNGEV